MPTFTIYTTSGDLSTLNAILNGVAMICQQTLLIWGFAIVAAFYRILHTITVATLASAQSYGGAAGAFANGSVGAFLPLALALMLTSPQMQGSVQIESSQTGAMSKIDNVPVVFSLLPAAGSYLSQTAGGVVETAYQGVGTDYPSISASGNGFINPLKVLLTSRNAIMRLGGIDSEIATVVAQCITSADAGTDYAAVGSAVTNAGNSGAGAAQSIIVSSLTDAPTAVGALLWRAAQNTTGTVPGISPNSQTILSCSDAAYQVAADIDTALSSSEFARVVQGAVNTSDLPVLGADHSVGTLATQYLATRTANSKTVNAMVAQGAAQANAEMINLLFSEIVGNQLNCLKADGANQTLCAAAMLQANEVERNNIQAAANENQMLKYAGQFGNFVIALIIGLGPVIVMLMMMSGVHMGPQIRTIAHLIVWPQLVMNVGAEVINGMIYIQVANFFAALAQGGFISQAIAAEAYKGLSLQVGTAAQLMAALPVLMSTIFMLGGAAAAANVQARAHQDKQTGDVAAPAETAGTPMMRLESPASAQLLDGGGVRMAMVGGLPLASGSVSFGEMTKEAHASLASERREQQSREEVQGKSNAIHKALSDGTFKRLVNDDRVAEAILRNYEKRVGTDTGTSQTDRTEGTRTNTNSSKAGVRGEISVGRGGRGGGADGADGAAESGIKKFLPVSASGGVYGGTETSATDNLAHSRAVARDRQLRESKALTDAIHDVVDHSHSVSKGSETSKRLDQILGTENRFQEMVMETKSNTDSTGQTLRNGMRYVAAHANIGANEIGFQADHNKDYQKFLAGVDGQKLRSIDGIQKYTNSVEQAMRTNEIDDVFGTPMARDAAIRHAAAVRLYEDEEAPRENRLAALEYLTNEGAAMTHIRMQPIDVAYKSYDIRKPEDKTSVDSEALRSHFAPHPTTAHVRPHPAGHAQPHGGDGHTPPPPVTGPHVSTDIPTDLKAEVLRDLHERQAELGGASANADKAAHKAGLDEHGHGTVIRTAANVADNVVDIGRDSTAASRTRMGQVPGESRK